MAQAESIQIIRDAFSHVEVERIVVEYDRDIQEDVAKIYVAENNLAAALGEDGMYPRRVAMKVGIAIEVELSDA